MKLVLFDIDGTLLWTDGAGRRAIHRALLDETGTAGPIETYRFDGKTDPQIVRELLALAGHPGAADEACIAAVCRRYVELLSAELAKPARATRLMVGIGELLAALEPHERASRACVGLLTGNLAPGAALKLQSAGLDPARFRVGAFGSDSHRRADLPAVAARRRARVRDARGHARRARRHFRLMDSSDSAAWDELEVKARVEDPDAVRRALERAGARLEFRGAMLDRRFDRDGALAARDQVLRLRIFQPADGAAAFGMLGWKGPHSQRGVYRHRAEAETRVTDPDAAVAILEHAGFAVTLRIDRTVEVYR